MTFNPESVQGFDLGVESRAPVSIKDRFIIPPFSVLRTMDGDWVARKRAWLSLGIESEVGRGGHLLGMSESNYEAMYDKDSQNGVLFKSQDSLNEIVKQGKNPTAVKAGLTFGEMPNYDGSNRNVICGTSIFDPVLCELAYRWWCPQNGSILDPFSGGSVRGIVAAFLERNYTGVDLRPEQIEANVAQWQKIGSRDYAADKPTPKWVVGNSTRITRLAPGEYDFVFSCPPYGDLEVYSDNPEDLSTMSHEAFMEDYRRIITRSCSLLKNDRFACFVVGDFRDKNGFYRNFVADTISAFLDAGLHFHNEAILVTAIGSLRFRITKQFNSGRKLGKTHQNILVFYKGDPKKIKENFGENF